jgi:hypothetical protein
MNNIGVVNSQLEEQCCSHEKCNESEQCANQSLKFPMEIIHCIYDYKKFEESCIINKDIYDYVKKKSAMRFIIIVMIVKTVFVDISLLSYFVGIQ